MTPAAAALMFGLGFADGVEEGAKGGQVGRQLLDSEYAQRGHQWRKTFKNTKDAAFREAQAGARAGIFDKWGDRANVWGAASAAFSVDEHGNIRFHPDRFDGIGVAQETANNYLSGIAVYYGAKGGAIAGAKLGALTGNPIGVVVGGLVGGVLGSVAASLAYDATGKQVVDAWADAASARRGSDNLRAVLARCQRQLQDARMHLADAEFNEAIRLAQQVQDTLSALQSAFQAAGLETQARQVNYAALEILGRVARLRLAANSKASAPPRPVPELRAARPQDAKPEAVWVLKEVIPNPAKTPAEYHPYPQQTVLFSASGLTGQVRVISKDEYDWTFGYTYSQPPAVIKPGEKFDIRVQGTAGGAKTDFVVMGEHDFGSDGIYFDYEGKTRTTMVGRYDVGRPVVTKNEGVFHCQAREHGREIWLQVGVFSNGSRPFVRYVYEKREVGTEELAKLTLGRK